MLQSWMATELHCTKEKIYIPLSEGVFDGASFELTHYVDAQIYQLIPFNQLAFPE